MLTILAVYCMFSFQGSVLLIRKMRDEIITTKLGLQMHVFHISLKNISFKLSHLQCRTFALGIFMMWHTFTLSIALCRTFCLGGRGSRGCHATLLLSAVKIRDKAATCSSPLLSQQWCRMTTHLSTKVVVEQHYMTVSEVPAVKETASWSTEFDKVAQT